MSAENAFAKNLPLPGAAREVDSGNPPNSSRSRKGEGAGFPDALKGRK